MPDRSRHLPIFVALAPLVWFIGQEALQVRAPSAAWGDWSLLELSTYRAGRFEQALGPYSRYGWSHPGPAFFYWAAPFHLLSGRQFGGLALAALVLNTAWMAVSLLAVRAAAGMRATWLASGVLLVWVLVYDLERLREPWNPLLMVLPVVAAAVCGAAVASGVRWAAPVAVVAVSFALQTHLGAFPLLAAIVAASLAGWWVFQRRSWPRWRWAVAVTAGAGVVLWFAPVWQQATHDPGNLGEIVQFFRTPGEQAPLSDVVALAVRQLAGLEWRLGHAIGPDAGLRDPTLVSVLGLGAMLIATGVVTRRAHAARDAFWCTLGAATLLGAVAAVVATTRATAPLMPYLTSATVGVSLLLWLCTARLASETLMSRRPARRELGAVAAVVLVLLAGASVVRVAGLEGYGETTRDDDLAAMNEALLDAVGDEPTVVGFVLADHATWPAIATGANAVTRQGSEVISPPGFEFMFGTEPGHPDLQFLFAEGARDGIEGRLIFVGPPGGRVDGFHVYLLDEVMRFG